MVVRQMDDLDGSGSPGCFFCGEPLTFPLVMWAGAEDKIFLHPLCAEDLHFRMARDIWDARRRAGHAHLGLAGQVTTPRAGRRP